jgi:hypothetical protein
MSLQPGFFQIYGEFFYQESYLKQKNREVKKAKKEYWACRFCSEITSKPQAYCAQCCLKMAETLFKDRPEVLEKMRKRFSNTRELRRAQPSPVRVKTKPAA